MKPFAPCYCEVNYYCDATLVIVQKVIFKESTLLTCALMKGVYCNKSLYVVFPYLEINKSY